MPEKPVEPTKESERPREIARAMRRVENRIWALMGEADSAAAQDRMDEAERHLDSLLEEYGKLEDIKQELETAGKFDQEELARIREQHFISLLRTERLITKIDSRNFEMSGRRLPGWYRDFNAEIQRSVAGAGGLAPLDEISDAVDMAGQKLAEKDKMLAKAAVLSVQAEKMGIPGKEIRDFDFELTAADSPAPLVSYTGYAQLFHIYLGRAARRAAEDYPDKEEAEIDLHAANNSLEYLADVWEKRYPPVAEYYRHMRGRSGLIFELAKKYYEAEKRRSGR